MKTSFSRAFFPAAILLLSALLLVGMAFQVLLRHYLQEQTLEELKDNGTTIAKLASAYYAEDSLTSREFLINLSVASGVSDVDAVICNIEGELLLCSDAPFGCNHQGMVIRQEYLQRVLQAGTVADSGMVQGLYPEPRFVVSVPIVSGIDEQLGIVMVSTPMSEVLSIMTRVSDVYLIISVLVVLAAVAVMNILARRQSNPLRKLAKAATDFGHGNLSSRVAVDPHDSQEMQELALAFNNMASSLQKSEYQRQEFVANVSHELKTPMTTIGGYIDGILDGTIPPERQKHYMKLVSDETKRLSRLVRSMLDIARLQDMGGIPESMRTRFDVCECAGQVLITFEQKILQKNLQVQVDFPEHPAYTRACLDYITQVIYNLVDNAVKFSPEGGLLGLKIREAGSKLYVSVSNNGPTIPPKELPLVFDRFHKLDKSRTRNSDGWGLGLYIIKTIVCFHGEDIRVSSQDNVTEFTFTLPQVT